jgi:2-(1,2-epoxy-1,2-dihydrophenyl)acetyl-CoA isomerase
MAAAAPHQAPMPFRPYFAAREYAMSLAQGGQQLGAKSMDEQPVLIDLRDGYRVVTLNRPQRLNACNEALLDALVAAFSEAENDASCRALLLTGAGRGFCAGQDLTDRLAKAEVTTELGGAQEKFYNPLVRKIRALPFPVVAAVNGVAAGAGANIALACDIVLAARSARFIQAFAKIGLVPDSGGTWSLARLVGEARAKALALTAEPLDAATAAEWGLIWRVVDDGALMAEADALARRLAQGPTRGYGLTKRAIQAAATNTLDAQLDLERDFQREAGRSADYAEGVAAFLDKRAPNFIGR